MTKNDAVEILLVEDNPNDAKLAMLALEEVNLANNLIWLKDGAEALDFLFGEGKYEGRNIENRPKIILLDLKMPKVDGIQVLERIKKDDKTKHIPVAVMTSSQEEKDRVSTYDLGVNSYIVKPIDFDQFTDFVKEVGYYWMVVNTPPAK
ncbi:MAG: response regulator [Crocinitomicaceae bacterium]|nr:response regulator [Crocinitomicaceae bacterium]